MAGRSAPCLILALLASAACLLAVPRAFVTGAAAKGSAQAAATALSAKPVYGERDPLPKGYGIRTGLSDLLKPLNSEYGVTAKEDSIPTYIVLLSGIVLLFLFYLLLLLINNQSVLLPPEDEFDEYVANFLPYFFFGEK
mmetsp:Transcript_14861/g.31135  ORF Transcript_14861/g.31135 Transcript_14861/m.31135 type:complete len:139 (-) Transcript_14861:174-590(-)